MVKVLKSNWLPIILLLIVAIVILSELTNKPPQKPMPVGMEIKDSSWTGPSLYTDQSLEGTDREIVIYGQELIAHTSNYLGPKGSVAQISNGMNCQNCHLDAGTRPWGNNYGAVYSTYPKFRGRSGSIEGIYKRINDCFERSLNGKGLDTTSPEMKAMYAYMVWVGNDVQKGKKPVGSGLEKLPFLNRAASSEKGQIVYSNKCETCHGPSGEGQLAADGKSYTYPPLWGEHSFNDGAGLFRLSSFAAFAINNMPYGQATHSSKMLTVEEAWDVAAFVNSQSRPHADQSKDYPDISKKPFDSPVGPYADPFNALQHKYGPFGPIDEYGKKSIKAKLN